MDWEGVIGLATIGLFLTALAQIWNQLRATRQLALADLFLRLSAEYQTSSMRELRRRFAAFLLSGDWDASTIDETLLIWLENISYLCRKKLLDREMVTTVFYYDIMYYERGARSLIAELRELYSDPGLFVELEWMASEVIRQYRRMFPKMKQKKDIFTDEHLVAFLRYESSLES